jgi:hypothetical protein
MLGKAALNTGDHATASAAFERAAYYRKDYAAQPDSAMR